MRFFIIHGTYGHAAENWFPWLQSELKARGHEVIIPTFSTPEGQSLERWLDEFELLRDEIDEDTILIGHSLGSVFILRLLERLDVQVRASILIAPFVSKLGIELDDLNQSFIEGGFNWDRIRPGSREFHVLISGNDPYVPLDEGQKVSNRLMCDPMIIQDAGHFNKEAGYEKFPVLLELIEGIIQEYEGPADSTLPL